MVSLPPKLTDSKAWKKKWNWQQSPRQMLTARVISEAVRVIDPGLIAGIYTEDEVVQGVEAERNDPLPPQKATRRELEILLAERDAIISSGEKPSSELLGQISDAKLDVEEYEEEVRVLNEKNPTEQPPEAPEPAKRGKTAKKPADAPQEAPASAQAAPNEPAWKSHVIAALSLKKFNGRRLDDLSAEEVEFLRVEWLEAYADKIPSNPGKLELANNLKEAIQFWNK